MHVTQAFYMDDPQPCNMHMQAKSSNTCISDEHSICMKKELDYEWASVLPSSSVPLKHAHALITATNV